MMHDCDCMNTRNRFNPENRFIGDIEDGKRYPFGVYTKEESDEKYAIKQTEANVQALAEAVSTKAEAADVSALEAVIDTKAAASDLESLETTVSAKADISALQALQRTVDNKATEAECIAIRARLDALEYQFIEISNYTISPVMCEYGAPATITLEWSLNKAATSQQINGMEVTGNSKQFTNVMTDQIYTLSVSDGKTSASSSVSVEFANQIYYGVAEDITMLSIILLSKELSNDKTRTFTDTAGSNQYFVYALPERLGAVAFYVEGFEGGFDDPVIMPVTNEVGYTEMYRVYKSTRTNLGTTTIEIKEE